MRGFQLSIRNIARKESGNSQIPGTAKAFFLLRNLKVERYLAKVETAVRFRSPAPHFFLTRPA